MRRTLSNGMMNRVIIINCSFFLLLRRIIHGVIIPTVAKTLKMAIEVTLREGDEVAVTEALGIVQNGKYLELDAQKTMALERGCIDARACGAGVRSTRRCDRAGSHRIIVRDYMSATG